MKRLFFDIETSPNIGLFWECGYKLNIPHDNIVTERAIICIGWKWSGERVRIEHWEKIDAPDLAGVQTIDEALRLWGNAIEATEKKLLERFIPILESADEVVTQNGDRFDIPWIRTRALHHGIPMSPNVVSIDTYKLAKYKFRFNSNRLDYLSQFMNKRRKIKTDYDLWKDVLLKNCGKALARMVRYCKRDVNILEEVWDEMNPYVQAKSHVGHGLCPECGGNRVIVNKTRISAAGYKRKCYQCQDCGKYHTVAEGGKLGKALQEAS